MIRAASFACSLVLIAVSAPAPATGGSGRAEDRHWSFVPPKRPAVPAVRESGWVRNPIDAFVLEKLEGAGLAHATEADRATLLRRLSFDLTGLPPSPEEIDNFLKDPSAEAYTKVVDRLLASPHYGERWAQHWLDLARYADTDGFEFDQARPDAWRYRDWVVGALNEDMPYDRFLTLQLAGDEAEPGDASAFVATGFNRCYPDMVDLNDQALRRQNALNDITETTGLAVLGLTIGCARCHDHKFDPISQRDFYRLQAFFAPARFRDDYPIAGPDRRGGSKSPPHARGIDEAGPDAPPTFVLRRGDFASKGEPVEPAFPSALADAAPSITPRDHSTGRRSALAAWLTKADHPLTARVIVNRLWQHHFGRGIVATPSDFGTMGAEPSHPELLDWLATELVARGWSLKALHRLMVTSSTYRQSTRLDPRAAAKDPENDLLTHQARRRLDGESIRDALLAVSGRLNPAMGGPGVFPELPAELTKLSSKGAVWPVSPRPEDRDRRSLYVFVRRNLRYPFFEAFDRPDTNASCPRRAVTTIAPQALSLLNGDLSRSCARSFAARVAHLAGTDLDSRITLAYRLALGRPPDAQERELSRAFLDDGGPEGLEGFCLALLNLNEFVYID